MSSTSPSNADLGYIIAPTDQDISNAITYATMKANKQLCLAEPTKYTWVNDNIVPYPCPAGLTCESGRCTFIREGCLAASVDTYIDCARHEVDCELDSDPTVSKCNICTYNTDNNGVTAPKPDPRIVNPLDCSPGDTMYYKTTSKDSDTEDPVVDRSLWLCSGLDYDPEPYTMIKFTKNHPADADPPVGEPQPVPCTSDDDCTSAAGGSCMLYGTYDDDKKNPKKASGYCVDTGAGYLEYRTNWVTWDGKTGTSQCVQTQPEFKKWCEMPWTRAGNYEDSPSDQIRTLETRIREHPDSKRHPPFYYDQNTGGCMITKGYCDRSIADGGFDNSFAKQNDFFGGFIPISTCEYPEGHGAEIRSGYDCCIPLGASFAKFLMGSTLYTDLKDVLSGDLNVGTFLKNISPYDPISEWVRMYSEDNLKINRELLIRNYGGNGIHAYSFEWKNPFTFNLYPHHYFYPYKRVGFLASEIQKIYPTIVRYDHYNNRFIVFDKLMYQINPEYAHLYNTMTLFERVFQHE